jgi:23S rRNA (cytidine1920-2'-O)/16S rRNA (cytidine1409-2'-O)-methyltransferase
VSSIEKTDIKDFNPVGFPEIDWVVADVSFTSLAKLIPSIRKAAPKARLLLLIKPQFELPRDRIPDGGVVTDDEDRHQAVETVKSALLKDGYNVVGTLDAKVVGRQGNREIFILTN